MGAKSWEVTDAFWSRVEPLVPARRERDPEKTFVRKPGGGCKPKPARVVFEAIVFVLRTGCQWKELPRYYGAPSTVHRYFQEWAQLGVFERLWKLCLQEYDRRRGIGWRWQSVDGATTKAPLGGEKNR